MTHDASGTSVPDNSATGPSFMRIPLAITRNPNISPSAKLVYGRLALYAGKNGYCNPSHDSLASEVGLKPSRLREILTELRAQGLIAWKRTRSSASFTLYSPECRNPGYQSAGKPTLKSAGIPAIKRGSLKRGSVKDVEEDVDCEPTHRKNRNAPPHVALLPPPKTKTFPDVRRRVAEYMAEDPSRPALDDYPTERKVAEIMDASGGSSESEVIECLDYYYETRGLIPGVKGGPRSFAWFPVVVQDYFSTRAARDFSASPPGHSGWEERNEVRIENEILKQAEAFDYASRKSA